MAQREKEETEVQITETLTLCVNNCGFYGNPATKNMCQSCFQAQIRPAPSSSGHEKRRSDPTRLAEPVEKGRDGKAEDRTATEVTVPLARKVNRCSGCGKRVGLTGFRCRCGELFCGEHRYSDRHECSFDYKAAGREAIQRENPVVRAAKIVRV